MQLTLSNTETDPPPQSLAAFRTRARERGVLALEWVFTRVGRPPATRLCYPVLFDGRDAVLPAGVLDLYGAEHLLLLRVRAEHGVRDDPAQECGCWQWDLAEDSLIRIGNGFAPAEVFLGFAARRDGPLPEDEDDAENTSCPG